MALTLDQELAMSEFLADTYCDPVELAGELDAAAPPRRFRSTVAGVSHQTVYPWYLIALSGQGPQPAQLVHDETNPHDALAIAVMVDYGATGKLIRIGWLPAADDFSDRWEIKDALAIAGSTPATVEVRYSPDHPKRPGADVVWDMAL